MARSSILVWLLITLLSLTAATHAEVPREVKRALAARDYDSAIAWLEPSAQSGDPDAAYELGKLYRLGKGVDTDLEAAAELFAVAAAAGNPHAQHLLALYLDSIGDQAEAHRLMTQAADSGHSRAARWISSDRNATGTTQIVTLILNGSPPPGSFDSDEISRADEQGLTPLMVAIRAGSLDWTSALLDAGAGTSAQDRLGNTPLHYAVSAGNLDLTSALLAVDAAPDTRSNNGSTPLHLATAAGNVAIARALIRAGADRNIPGDGGWSAEQLAARSTDPDLLKLFSINPTQRATAQNSANAAVKALARATLAGDLTEMGLLINAGAAVDDADANGDSAITHAIRADKADALKLLLKHSEDPAAQREAMFVAAESGASGILEWLLAGSADVNATDTNGDSALIHAARADCAACVTLLLKSGATSDLRNEQGDTALLIAVRNGNRQSAESLALVTAIPDLLDANKRSALWWASKLGFETVSRRLLQRGASQIADEDGRSPLHIAALENRAGMISILTADADIDTLTPSGNSPLILAASKNAVDTLGQLLEAGADLELRNATGDTALIVATQAEAYDAASTLIDAGASPRTRNNQFESAQSIVEKRNDARWQTLLASSEGSGLLNLFN